MSAISQHPDPDDVAAMKPHRYRYDGVDADGQHWLERLEVNADGEEICTEDYVPIRHGYGKI